MPPAAFARELRGAGLPVEDDQVLTPLCSVQTYLERHGDVSVLPFVTDSARGYLEEEGVRLVDGGEHERIDAVFVGTSEGRRLREARARRPRGHLGRPASDRELRRRLRRGERPHLEPRSHGDGCHRQGERQTADDRRQAFPCGGERDRDAPRDARRGDRRDRRRPPPGRRPRPSGRLADGARTHAGSAGRSTSAVSPRGAARTSPSRAWPTCSTVSSVSGRECGRVPRTARARRLAAVRALARR